jgi:hypothetical protein
VKVINASRGPALVNEPTRYKSNPLSDILLGECLDIFEIKIHQNIPDFSGTEGENCIIYKMLGDWPCYCSD